jgi:hypothetical protein
MTKCFHNNMITISFFPENFTNLLKYFFHVLYSVNFVFSECIAVPGEYSKSQVHPQYSVYPASCSAKLQYKQRNTCAKIRQK